MFRCDVCEKLLSSKSSLNTHKKRHSIPRHERKTHICIKCLKGFTQKNSLRRHEWVCRNGKFIRRSFVNMFMHPCNVFLRLGCFLILRCSLSLRCAIIWRVYTGWRGSPVRRSITRSKWKNEALFLYLCAITLNRCNEPFIFSLSSSRIPVVNQPTIPWTPLGMRRHRWRVT